MCTCDGYIVDIYGLYQANKNNASIIEDIFKKDNDLIYNENSAEESES